MEDNRRNNSLWALLLTLLITVGTLALLMRYTLRYEQFPDSPDLTQLAQDTIMFGGEYVMLGNTMDNVQNDLMDQASADPSMSPEQGDEPDIEADDMEDAGEVNQKTPPLVTQKTESPHKVKEQPKPTEPRPIWKACCVSWMPVVLPSRTPVVRITRAVMLSTMNVSMNTPAMATNPC